METAAGVERLRLKFPGAPALTFRDLTFSVRRGERVLLLGPSGCGKSTLLQVLTGLIPEAIDVPIAADSIRVPDKWAYVFQDPDTQFCMPFVDEELAFVLENLLVPRADMPRRMEALLERVGLRLDRLHTPIASLSQGMKQRLAIASALALEPDVLFVDEPTSLLDPEGTKQVWETIREAGAGRTVVIVEHKIDEIVDYVDRVVLFNRSGEITADGPARDVFAEQADRLVEDGIWYPGVWDDYVRSGRFPARERVTADGAARPETPLVRLNRFAVCRGKDTKLRVEAADIRAGEWIAVVGPNGAGKSTLLLGLMQLLRTEGEYALNGRPAGSDRRLSDEIAFVFQNPEFQFVTNSVYDEIAFSLRQDKRPEAEVEAKTAELLAAFDLADRRDHHPFQLSLGQKRRLSVASAIVKEQRILLLDEPTFGQDARSTFALLEKLESWRRRGTAIVMVTHDPDIVSRFATRVWDVSGGELRADRSPEQWKAAFDAAQPAGRDRREPGRVREEEPEPCR
ncbi:ABC transporter ATP-binding protein [Paenibacillus flagellatus]|uniref:ABC transporter n=1 Tax=Paenibacillus flagellatus TaxID=2211139 RepID=A0A2V5K3A8_9BACL|nr:ABC transporter ATP-binding protein [Paenibacillus flagellatus]PYI52073.1 ABC transporter [Paenibacillus flagellatus]